MASITDIPYSNVHLVDYHVDSYASASGNSGSGYGGAQCCALVVDAICLAAILGSIAGASVLIARTIQIEITNVKRSVPFTGEPAGRKRSLPFMTFFLEGRNNAFAVLYLQLLVPHSYLPEPSKLNCVMLTSMMSIPLM